jgi:D-alanine-D-alanine ligase
MRAARPAVILYGAIDAANARPDEADGLVQVEAVAIALQDLGWAVETLPVTLDLSSLAETLKERRPQFAFNLVEAMGGHDRLMPLLPPLLDALCLPYTGARGEAASLTVNKIAAKRVMTAAGIPTAPWCEVGRPAASGRWIVKSATEHASVGLDAGSVVDSRRVARRIREAKARFGGPWFAERYIEGREYNISILDGPDEPEVLPLAEMRFLDFPPDRPKIVDYAAKWDEDSIEAISTRRAFGTAEPELAARLRALALRCWEVFGLTGYARVDVRVDDAGQPFVLEINVNPCIAPEIGLAAAAEEAGLSYTQLVGRIVDAALTCSIRQSIAA